MEYHLGDRSLLRSCDRHHHVMATGFQFAVNIDVFGTHSFVTVFTAGHCTRGLVIFTVNAVICISHLGMIMIVLLSCEEGCC